MNDSSAARPELTPLAEEELDLVQGGSVLPKAPPANSGGGWDSDYYGGYYGEYGGWDSGFGGGYDYGGYDYAY